MPSPVLPPQITLRLLTGGTLPFSGTKALVTPLSSSVQYL